MTLSIPSARSRSNPFSLAGFAAALLLVGGATAAGLLIAPRWGNAAAVLLYLPPVLACGLYFGLGAALTAAVCSALAFNFYFIPPYGTFRIDSPADVVTVGVLFLVAVVTSQLAGSVREQALLAQSHADRNATIAGFARRLLSCTTQAEIGDIAVDELARLFACHAVLVTGPQDPHVVTARPAPAALAPSDFAAAALTLATGEPAGRGVRRVDVAEWQFRPIASDRAVIAAIGLARPDGLLPVIEDQVVLLTSLLDQVALALERARLEEAAREAATLHERDRVRSALLASIGDDVKPRLTAILSAARALKRGGGADKDAVAAVASEAARLDRYIDNLVDLSPGSEQTPIAAGPLAIDLFRRTVHRDGVEVHLTPKEYAVLAELARHAGRVLSHAQILRAVWGPAHEGQIEYLRVAVRALRQKLESDPARPELILNEPAVGYRLVAG
ncbi:MAG: DUF4118 domain-containing protein [Croceibacterium sp.]